MSTEVIEGEGTMFIDVYTAIFLWTFAIFGVILFILKIYQSTRYVKKIDKGKLSVIISAKDQQDIIEGIVRGFVLRAELESRDDLHLNIVLVDAGSNDETADIMERLREEYCFIKLLEPEELSAYLDSM